MYGTSGGRERREKVLCTEELWASQGEGPGRIEPGLAKTGLGGPPSGKLCPPWEGPRAVLGDQVFLLNPRLDLSSGPEEKVGNK